MNAIDTNVLVYALSSDEPQRHATALDLLERLSPSDTIILWQVAVELGAVVSRRFRAAKAHKDIFDVARALRSRFPIAMPSQAILTHGLEYHLAYQVSYWDALLLAGAKEAGVARLYSEDLQSSRVIDGIEIVNPFAA